MWDALPLLTDLPRIKEGRQPAPGPDEVHIWRHDHSADVSDARRAEMLAILSPDERERAAQIRDEGRRRQFVTGRALCRRILSFYAPVRPADWRFALGGRGKPSIAAPVLASPIWFSLSHADGLSVCAVTGAGPALGVDIEQIANGKDALPVAEQFFPDAEVQALRRLSPSRQGEGFVRLWALKESYVKAKEISLTDGIAGAAFDLARGDDIAVAFAESLGEQAEAWRFRLFRLDDASILALAVQGAAKGPLSLRAGILL
jgi:4'-phosphopantetheinyl transferase